MNNLNGPTSKKEIGLEVKNLTTKKSPGLDSFCDKLYQIYLKEIISILHKLFQKI